MSSSGTTETAPTWRTATCNDETVTNAAPTAGDQFMIKPQGNRVRFDRVNLGLFFVDLTSERLTATVWVATTR